MTEMLKIHKMGIDKYNLTLGDYVYRLENGSVDVRRVDKAMVGAYVLPDAIQRLKEWLDAGASFTAGEYPVEVVADKKKFVLSGMLHMIDTFKRLESLSKKINSNVSYGTPLFDWYWATGFLIDENRHEWEEEIERHVEKWARRNYENKYQLPVLMNYYRYAPIGAYRFVRKNFYTYSQSFPSDINEENIVLMNGCTKNQIISLWFRHSEAIMPYINKLNPVLSSKIVECEMLKSIFEREIASMNEIEFLSFFKKKEGKYQPMPGEMELML